MYRRHLMLFAIIISFLFLIGVSINMMAFDRASWHCNTKEIESPKDFSDSCMEIWMTMDLIQAIHATSPVKENALRAMGKSLKQLYQSTEVIQQKVYRSNTHMSQPEADMLVAHLKATFISVFRKKKSKQYKKVFALLNRLEQGFAKQSFKTEISSTN